MRSISYKNQNYTNLYYQQRKKTTKLFKPYSQIRKCFIVYTILTSTAIEGKSDLA